MEKRKLKKYLASVQVPEYSSQGLQETISQAKKIRFHPEKQRMTNLQFFRNQLYFIRKEFWGLKLLFTGLFLCLILSEPAEPDSWIWTFSAISGPMLCLANAKILCDIFQPGMLELQMTAKHSLRKILAFRLLLSGVLDFLTLACRNLYPGAGRISAADIAVYAGSLQPDVSWVSRDSEPKD